MAPHVEEGVKTVAPPSHKDVDGTTYCFWNRLNTLPVVQSAIETTIGIYASSKEKHVIIEKGLGCIEYGVVRAAEPVRKVASAIVEKYPVATTTVTKLDHLACNALESLEMKVPAIQKPPMQLVSSMKKGTSTAIHTGVRKVMRSYPGQQMVKGLDQMIEWSEVTVNLHQQKKMAEELLLGSVEQHGGETEDKDQPSLTLKNGVVIPLKLYLQALKMVKHLLANMAGVKTRPASTCSPRKAVDVKHRKKVSPKKRLAKSGMVTRMAGSVMAALGIRTNEDVCLHMQAGEIENMNETNEKKRKHEECLDEEDFSDCESLNLASALDNYNSGDDSDYMPGDDPSDDSLEYNSGDAESDVETEEAGRSKKGEPLKQIIDKKVKEQKPMYPGATSPRGSHPKAVAPGVPVPPPASSPKVVLQPEWNQKPEQEAKP